MLGSAFLERVTGCFHRACFFLLWLSACSAPIFARPRTTLERVRIALGQIVSAAFNNCFRSSSVILTVTEVVRFPIYIYGV